MECQDLLKQVNDLSPAQRNHYQQLADHFHFEIHKMASVMGVQTLMKCAIGKKKNGPPELLSSNVTMAYKSDPEYAKSALQCFYPLDQFVTMMEIAKQLNGASVSPSNAALSRVSEEAALKLIKE